MQGDAKNAGGKSVEFLNGSIKDLKDTHVGACKFRSIRQTIGNIYLLLYACMCFAARRRLMQGSNPWSSNPARTVTTQSRLPLHPTRLNNETCIRYPGRQKRQKTKEQWLSETARRKRWLANSIEPAATHIPASWLESSG